MAYFAKGGYKNKSHIVVQVHRHGFLEVVSKLFVLYRSTGLQPMIAFD
ncbi:MAG: hypothetical protein JSV59_00190 [Flavobacteriaceae bacterium]|nr:MAG: hypothetical protein JSV59_00190 [Flavobacteriaceae bacterium]